MYITRRKDEFLERFNKIDKEKLNTILLHLPDFQIVKCVEFFEVSYTAPHTKTLYYKRGFFNNIYFLFFRKIALPMVIFMLLFVVLLS
jgi:hypothetical protein